MLIVRKSCLATAAAAALLTVSTSSAVAQSSIASYGVTAAAFGWQDGHQEQALGAIIQLTPTRWLALGASPTLLRVTGVNGSESRFGVTDLPVYAGVVHSFAAPWRWIRVIRPSPNNSLALGWRRKRRCQKKPADDIVRARSRSTLRPRHTPRYAPRFARNHLKN